MSFVMFTNRLTIPQSNFEFRYISFREQKGGDPRDDTRRCTVSKAASKWKKKKPGNVSINTSRSLVLTSAFSSFVTQAATLRPYLSAVRCTLEAAMCLENFSSQVVERHNKPEVEIR